MAETRKFYTFLNVTDGADAKNVTTVVTLSRFEMKELEENKKVLHCTAGITNKTKALSDALGCEVVATKNDNGDENVWIDVSFWNALAERFQKFVGDREKVRVVLCGRLSVRKWNAADGSERQRVQLSANDWFALPSPAAKQEPEELY